MNRISPFGKKNPMTAAEQAAAVQRAAQIQTGAAKEGGQPEETNNEPTPINELPAAKPASSLAAMFGFNKPSANSGREGQLPLTAVITTQAQRLVEQLEVMIENGDFTEDQIIAAIEDHDDMDRMIEVSGLIPEVDDKFFDQFRGAKEVDYENMIRSQQSKRSRSKGKEHTVENIRTMMVGAFAENILRIVSNKPKQQGGGGSLSELGYTDEELENFRVKPDDLKKEIRNVQSKKSIMKSKAGFAETDERWQQLLRDEVQLKALRDGGTAAISEEVKAALELKQELLDIDPESLNGEEALRLIQALQERLASK